MGWSSPREDIFWIEVVFFKSRDFGIAELFLDGVETGQTVDFYNATLARMDIRFEKPVFMTDGSHKLELRIVGKNDNSGGYNMAPVAFLVTGASQWAKEWNVVVRFPGGRDFGYGTPYPPEQGVDISAKYTGIDNKEIG